MCPDITRGERGREGKESEGVGAIFVQGRTQNGGSLKGAATKS